MITNEWEFVALMLVALAGVMAIFAVFFLCVSMIHYKWWKEPIETEEEDNDD